MTSPWLVLDATYLCYRAYHVFRDLSYDDLKTGVLYGVFRDIVSLTDRYNTRNIAFCFDHGKKEENLRRQSYPEYKAKRPRPTTPEQRRLAKEFARQVRKLHTKYLPELGYNNVFYQRGYEADDLIAAVCTTLKERDKHSIIIGSDHDLYQLLAKKVSMWDPRTKELMTKRLFVKKYGVQPKDWIMVKAIAGCSSDNIAGVPGVGEITALRFLRGELKKESKLYREIVNSDSIIRRNRRLVKLPLFGLDPIEIRKDNVSNTKWRDTASKLGMRTITTTF